MKRFFLILFCLLPSAYAVEEPIAVLSGEFWFTPRNGEVILSHEGVRSAVKKLIAEPDAYLILRHPVTESGELWGQELQAWLVSLGVVSDRIELQSNAELLEAVELIIAGSNDEAAETPLEINAVIEEETQVKTNVVSTPLSQPSDTVDEQISSASEQMENVVVEKATVEEEQVEVEAE